MGKKELLQLKDEFVKNTDKGFKKLIKNEDKFNIIYALGELLIDDDDFISAKKLFEKAMEMAEKEKNLLEKYKFVLNYASVVESMEDIDGDIIYKLQKELDKAEKFFKEKEIDFLPKVILFKGMIEVDFENYEEALREFEEGIRSYNKKDIKEDSIKGWFYYYKAYTLYLSEEKIEAAALADLLDEANKIFRKYEDEEGEAAILEFLQDLN
ncbi:hypothetical protein J7L48_05325 [bacterium]|nr:hypothetical protein [bacterium]